MAGLAHTVLEPTIDGPRVLGEHRVKQIYDHQKAGRGFDSRRYAYTTDTLKRGRPRRGEWSNCKKLDDYTLLLLKGVDPGAPRVDVFEGYVEDPVEIELTPRGKNAFLKIAALQDAESVIRDAHEVLFHFANRLEIIRGRLLERLREVDRSESMVEKLSP